MKHKIINLKNKVTMEHENLNNQETAQLGIGAVRRSIAQVLLDDYTNDQLRLVLKETSTRYTKDRVYSEEVVRLIDHENIKDDDIYFKLGYIYKVVGHVITQKVLRDEF